MRLVPRNVPEKIQFYRTHLPAWAEHAGEIGTSAQLVADLEALTDEAQAALAGQRAAQQAARAATQRLHQAAEKMGSLGAKIVMQIRTQAALAGPGVNSLALIDRPATPAPIGPPGTPFKFTADLQQIGWLTLRWKCKNPRGSTGTMYQVWRRTGFSGPFEFLGNTGTRKFVDRTVPAGAIAVTYQVQAVRSTKAGQFATHNVNFGTTRGSVPSASMTPKQPAKLAA
jgi:hypothetical protein